MNENQLIISSRIRLARNIDGVPFPSRLSNEEKVKLNHRIRDALILGNSAISSRFHYIDMEDMPYDQAMDLVQRHLISLDFAQNPKGRGLLLLDDESVSIMLNEEDHIRIQVIMPGQALEEALETADRIDSLLSENLNIAFDEKLGYLTECPSNLGTGLRASLMIHLPISAKTGYIARLSGELSKLGFTIRGSYGEGSRSVNDFFQISNQITLGMSENEILKKLVSCTHRILNEEMSMIEKSVKSIEVRDRIHRSCGILKNAYLLSSEEFSQRISDVRLGIISNEITDVSLEAADRLISHIQTGISSDMSPQKRDTLRAEKVRKAFEK